SFHRTSAPTSCVIREASAIHPELSGTAGHPASVREAGGPAPLTAEDELGQWLSRPLGQVAGPEVFGQRGQVPAVPDGERGERPDAGRDAVQLAGRVREDADHLVDRQPAGGGLQDQVGARESEVVFGGRVRLAGQREIQAGTAEGEYRSGAGPDAIPVRQAG